MTNEKEEECYDRNKLVKDWFLVFDQREITDVVLIMLPMKILNKNKMVRQELRNSQFLPSSQLFILFSSPIPS